MRSDTALAVLLLLLALPAGQPLLAAESEISPADDLAKTAQLSLQQGIPTVVFVSRDACPYCRTLREAV